MLKKDMLYYLLKEFVKGNYTVHSFCDAFCDVYYTDFPKNELCEREINTFDALGIVISRFSPYDEDIMKFPGVYATESDVVLAIKTALETLEKI